MPNSPIMPTDVGLKLSYNFTDCNPHDGDSQYHFFGEHLIETITSTPENCIVKYYYETEGGYSKYTCEVPHSLGDFQNFDQISDYCKVRESGSLFTGLSTYYYYLPGNIQISIPQTYLLGGVFLFILIALFYGVKKLLFRIRKRIPLHL